MNHLMTTSKQIPQMSSLEIVEFINDYRFKNDENPVQIRHADFIAKVPKVLGELSEKYRSVYKDKTGRTLPCYVFYKREACLMAMSYSYELQAIVFDRMTELESQVLKPQLPDFTNPVEAARAWANEVEEKQIAQKQLEFAAPKIEFVEKYVESVGNKGFREVAKLLKIKEPKFREFLTSNKIMYRLNGALMGYANHIDAGRFHVSTGLSQSGHAFNQCLFTPKGVEWIAAELAKESVRGK